MNKWKLKSTATYNIIKKCEVEINLIQVAQNEYTENFKNTAERN